ncbi:unnamed protein product [Penicillium salamii]|uniref:GPI anchored protein n=1 Tax=Penicillium salamii TaxID=1612424 RepID=A0A9W4IX76_9EURO|nr:unnamed protein product [Penicillium salamii]
MRASTPRFAGIVASFLFFANIASSASPEILKDEPRLYANVSLNTDTQGFAFSDNSHPELSLVAREYVCSVGYSECAYNSMKCCPIGSSCCGNGYCADPGETCCSVGGTCRSGFKCCAGTDGCAPIGGECCSDGTYCRAGKECRTFLGRKTCCAPSGCIGEHDSGSDDLGVTAPTLTETATATETETETVTSTSFKYYYTTIYWTYYYYFWTSYAPYTAQTVTSTRTTTTTVWSVLATNSLEADVELISSSRDYTFSAPYSATSLKASSEPVTTSTRSAAPTSISTSSVDDGEVSGSGDPGMFPDSAAGTAGLSFSVSTTGLIAGTLAAAIGGLAFGL